jgi:hemoglobin
MKNDINTREDIVLLVDSFYEKVNQNKVIGHIFNEVAKVNWKEHMPKMYSFWASILLGEHSYTGNPMIKHVELSRITPMTEVEFSVWLLLFAETVDSLFQGKNAEEAKVRAANIARLMLFKIEKKHFK